MASKKQKNAETADTGAETPTGEPVSAEVQAQAEEIRANTSDKDLSDYQKKQREPFRNAVKRAQREEEEEEEEVDEEDYPDADRESKYGDPEHEEDPGTYDADTTFKNPSIDTSEAEAAREEEGDEEEEEEEEGDDDGEEGTVEKADQRAKREEPSTSDTTGSMTGNENPANVERQAGAAAATTARPNVRSGRGPTV